MTATPAALAGATAGTMRSLAMRRSRVPDRICFASLSLA